MAKKKVEELEIKQPPMIKLAGHYTVKLWMISTYEIGEDFSDSGDIVFTIIINKGFRGSKEVPLPQTTLEYKSQEDRDYDYTRIEMAQTDNNVDIL